jgi:UDP-N-acetylglucosamine:LPS N-acetylglucosamine transferase
MSVIVEIKKETSGFKVGDKKSLTLENAKYLEDAGIAKIIGSSKTKQTELIDLKNTVEKQGVEIEKLKKEIKSLKK